ncbi:hypothetical protein [Paraburkholderia sp. BL10I2N1]|nr:hypothetical protein [Paraburkholderia sp. BL10I2N1]
MARIEAGPGDDVTDAARSGLTFLAGSRKGGQPSGDVSFQEWAT